MDVIILHYDYVGKSFEKLGKHLFKLLAQDPGDPITSLTLQGFLNKLKETNIRVSPGKIIETAENLYRSIIDFLPPSVRTWTPNMPSTILAHKLVQDHSDIIEINGAIREIRNHIQDVFKDQVGESSFYRKIKEAQKSQVAIVAK